MLPLARKVGRLTQIVEPIVSVILAPDGKNTDRMPNEDSVSFQFDDTSLFFQEPVRSIDRVEGGPRINYGLNSGFVRAQWWVQFFLHRAKLQADESDDFDQPG